MPGRRPTAAAIRQRDEDDPGSVSLPRPRTQVTAPSASSEAQKVMIIVTTGHADLAGRGDGPQGAPEPPAEGATPAVALNLRIAVLTYRRPQDIATLLPLLVDQARQVSALVSSVDVVVVDNDPEGSARAIVEAVAGREPAVPVHYEHEPRPGISAGRNRALASAQGHDLLVFIDDDERPLEGWLRALLQTREETGCAAVVGAVVSEYEVEPGPWVQAGGFFERRRPATGTRVDVAATNNLLLDLRVVRRSGLTFDERFGLSGGGDTMFTRSLHARGGEMVWCDEAVVVDVVPAARVTRDWVMRRAFRSGSSWSSTSLQLAPGAGTRTRTRVVLSGRGTVRILGGLGRLTLGRATGSLRQQARGQRTIARGAGMLSGAWGFVYSEYKRA